MKYPGKYLVLLLLYSLVCLSASTRVIAQEVQPDSSGTEDSNAVKPIRISVLPFINTGNSNEKHDFLSQSIPSMLVSGLSSSRGFQLIESENSADLDWHLENASKGLVDASFYNDSTLLSIGNELLHNYIIYGSYWSYDNYIRIDLRCVSVESKEIILSEGIDVKSIEMLSENITEVSGNIRQHIEFNVLERNSDVKNIAIIVVDPNTESGLKRGTRQFIGRKSTLLEKKVAPIYSTFVRKLRSNTNLRIKEAEQMYQSTEDKWMISNVLGAQYIVSLEFDVYGNDNFLVNIELFDARLGQFLSLEDDNKIVEYTQKSVTGFLNEKVNKINSTLNVEDSSGDFRSIRTPIFLRRWHLGFRQSTIQRPESGKFLFLEDGIGRYSEWFVNYRINSRLSLEFQLGRDHGKSIDLFDGDDQDALESRIDDDNNAIVTSRQQNLVLHYDIYRGGALSLYSGVGAAFFGVGRAVDAPSGNEEQAGQTGYGGILVFGAMISLEQFFLTAYLEPRLIVASRIREATTQSGFHFSGGRLGGFYSTFGVAFNFPL